MAQAFDLEAYLSAGIELLIKDALRATLKHPKQSAFFLSFAKHAQNAAKLRHQAELGGVHIPTFLIASITQDCNLRCAGCYAQANEQAAAAELSDQQWDSVFTQAGEMGVSLVLLAGGEPLMRKAVIERAAKHKELMFPVFTNATMVDDAYLALFDKHRNLVPIISLEGDEAQTDSRRGEGIFRRTVGIMKTLQKRGILYGVSLTATSQNLSTITQQGYVDWLKSLGCKVMMFIEYVPFEDRALALSQAQRDGLAQWLQQYRPTDSDIIMISFPGDEQETGGCLAAGRGFFHINAAGGAEPCPFSPYSDVNVKQVSLRDALHSPLFQKLRDSGLLLEEHTGGCTLFDLKERVATLTNQE